MIKDENEIKAITKVTHTNVVGHSTDDLLNPVLSKQNLHDYFANKMASFSIILGHIFDKLQALLPHKGPEISSLSSLHKKLERLQSRFLVRYHKLTSKTSNQLDVELLKPIFEHINRFEKKLISEVLNAGIEREELQEWSEKHLLLLSIKS